MNDCKLFSGISAEETERLLKCLSPVTVEYKKGQILLFEGQTVTEVGIVRSGVIDARKDTPDGTSAIVTRIKRGGVFGEALCSSGMQSPVTLYAVTDCTVQYIDFFKMMHPCEKLCSRHNTLILNLSKMLADYYFVLHERISCLMLKNLRGKILQYLHNCAKKRGSNTFDIAFDREELADYLACDRSALSRELSKMKNEGIIDYRKNKFTIK